MFSDNSSSTFLNILAADDNLPMVAAGMIFVAILLLFAAMHYYSRYRQSRVKIIEKIRSGASDRLEENPLTATLGAQGPSTSSIIRVLGALGSKVQPEKADEVKRRNLDFLRAGIRKGNAVAVFWGVKCSLALILAGAFLTMKPVFFPLLVPINTMLFGLALAAMGFYGPDAWLKRRIANRKEKIQLGLPDALDLLVVCVEAGMSLDAAIHRVGEEIRLENRELSDEFILLNLEIRAGKSRRDAMKNLALRTDLEDINSLVTLLVQTDKYGTSVAQALRVYSDMSRTQRMQRAEQKAAELTVKLMIPLVFFVFPAMLVVLLGPPFIKIFRTLVFKQ